jgi:hypothetical protein
MSDSTDCKRDATIPEGADASKDDKDSCEKKSGEAETKQDTVWGNNSAYKNIVNRINMMIN